MWGYYLFNLWFTQKKATTHPSLCFDFDKNSLPSSIPAFQVEKTDESGHIGVVEKVRRPFAAGFKADSVLAQMTRPIRFRKSGKRMVQQEKNLHSATLIRSEPKIPLQNRC